MKLKIKDLDKRVLRRYLDKGLFNKAEMDAYLNALPDLSDACDNIYDDIFNAQGRKDAHMLSSTGEADV